MSKDHVYSASVKTHLDTKVQTYRYVKHISFTNSLCKRTLFRLSFSVLCSHASPPLCLIWPTFCPEGDCFDWYRYDLISPMLDMRSGCVHSNMLVLCGQRECWCAHSYVVIGLFFTLSCQEKEMARHGLISLLTREVISVHRRVTWEWINSSICLGEEGRGYLKQTTQLKINHT